MCGVSSSLPQELTCWAEAAEEEEEEEGGVQELDVSAMALVDLERQLLGGAERRAQRLALLQVLAVMVERVQHSVLLRKNVQVSGRKHVRECHEETVPPLLHCTVLCFSVSCS